MWPYQKTIPNLIFLIVILLNNTKKTIELFDYNNLDKSNNIKFHLKSCEESEYGNIFSVKRIMVCTYSFCLENQTSLVSL